MDFQLLRTKSQINRTKSDSSTSNKENRLQIQNRNDNRRRSVRERSPRKISATQMRDQRRAHSWDAAIDGGLDTEARLAQLLSSEEHFQPIRKMSNKRPLEEICLHCKFTKELANRRLRDAIETALRELELTGDYDTQSNFTSEYDFSPVLAASSRNKPEIIVSSVSSEEGSISSMTDGLSEASSTHDTPPSPCPTPSSCLSDSLSSNTENSLDGQSMPIPSISVTECLDQLSSSDNGDMDGDSSLTPRDPTTGRQDRSMSIQTVDSDRTLVLDAGFCDSGGNTPMPLSPVTTGPISPFRTPLDSISSCTSGCTGCFKPMCWSHIQKLSFLSRRESDSDASNASVDFRDQFLNNLELPSCSSVRSSSIDISSLRREIARMNSVDEDEDSSVDGSDIAIRPSRDRRSKSVDITAQYDDAMDEQPTRLERLSILFRKALVKSPILRQHVQLSLLASSQDKALLAENKHRQSRYWNAPVSPTDHIWVPGSSTSSGSGFSADCYIGERDCKKSGEKKRCVACHVLAHSDCLPLLNKMNLHCKPTYQEPASKLQQLERDTLPHRHHWVHRWRQEGKCNRCNKSFQQRFFKEKDLKAIACSWCKVAYHNKHGCFTMAQIDESCDMGNLREVLIPPSWITRIPVGKASTIRRRHTPTGALKRKHSKNKKMRSFIVRPIGPPACSPRTPVVIFVNPKSGGNKGAKLINTFAWLVNPRQVFDIIALKGPKFGLEMYRRIVSRTRILVCGGDGTIGWLLATLDSLKWPSYPPLAILPLGTGNDLARTLGWGGSFMDEPLTEILTAVAESSVVTLMDRWRLNLEHNEGAEFEESAAESAEEVVRDLPLSVMNNYFSIGADAHVALQFHQSRSANPEIFSSRFKNRLFYGGIGTVDLFKRSWKDLSEFISLECDGVDMTPMIKGSKFHCLLFLNIPRYAGGTLPWGNPSVQFDPIWGSGNNSPGPASAMLYDQREFLKPALNDGKIEVLGLTSATLAAIQVGGHGDRIAQCSQIRIVTKKPIPVQVDGEPCRLAPSIITISLHSKVPMLKRLTPTQSSGSVRKPAHKSSEGGAEKSPTGERERCPSPQPVPSSPIASTSVYLKIPLAVLSRKDYDAYREDSDHLKQSALEIGMISVESEMELEKVREMVQGILDRKHDLPYVPSLDWHFVDCKQHQ